jgi:hypothetical protein
MNTKHTLMLLIIAILLGIAAYWYTQKEEKMLQTAAPAARPVFSGLTSATVERIEIDMPPAQHDTLTKVDGVWYANVERKHRVDPNYINTVFSTIEKEVTGEVVSDNPEHYADYDLTPTSATRVRIFGRDNKLLVDLYIGKSGPTLLTTFVRKADEKEVLHADAGMPYVFKRPDGWRDRKVFDFSQDAIVEVSGELTSGPLHVRKEGGLWKLHRPINADVSLTKLNPFLSSIANLRAVGFADLDSSHTLASYGLDPAVSKLTITYEDKQTSPPAPRMVTLLLGSPKVENNATYVYARRTDSNDIFKLTDYQGKMLTPDPKDFAITEPTPTPSSGAGATSGTLPTEAPASAAKAQSATAASPAAAASSPSAPRAAATPAVKTGGATTATPPHRTHATSGTAVPQH